MPPLFIPLKKVYFDQFLIGEKRTEYRVYGPRWNEGTITRGRKAVLSCGYSGPRIDARVVRLRKVRSSSRKFLTDFFGPGVVIAAIDLDL